MTNYTEEMIQGVMPRTILPKGCSLVLEGGGTRGFYTAGVFEAFMDEGIMFPYIVSVSAGTANAMSYVSGQKGRTRQIIEKYVSKHQYLSFRNLIMQRSYFGYDYVFKTVPEQHVFWDRNIFINNKIDLLTGAVDCNTGKTVWFHKDELEKDFTPAIASCSVPLASKVVLYKGYELLDGGTSSPIPIDKAIVDGNTFHVIVLTRNEGYRKKPFQYKKSLQLYYKKYPKLVDTMLKRHEIYNQQLELCEQLEKEGKAIIIRPKKRLEVGRIAKNIKKLLDLHDEGYEEGKEAVKLLLKRLGNGKI